MSSLIKIHHKFYEKGFWHQLHVADNDYFFLLHRHKKDKSSILLYALNKNNTKE